MVNGWSRKNRISKTKFLAEKDKLKGMLFECNTKTEDTTELNDLFNNEEVVDLDKALNEGIDFDEMISSGQFASV